MIEDKTVLTVEQPPIVALKPWPWVDAVVYYEDEYVRLYHGDARVLLPTMSTGSVDLVLTDPPYGIGFEHKLLGNVFGDDKVQDITFLLLFGTKHIIWGGHHFSNQFPSQSRWLMWLKHDPGLFSKRDHGSFDLAWTDLGGSVRAYKHIWDGSIREGDEYGTVSLHPTQKPLSLMKWCIEMVNGSVCDPFMGSGTTLRAAKDLGRKSIGIEIEEKYCEIAARRLSQEVLNL